MRVAVVGIGRIGRLHAETLRDLDGVDVLVADAEPGRAAAVANELDVEPTDDPFAADALVVAAPTTAHAPLLHRAVAAGLPAFCEKPVALDLPTLDALAAAIEERGAFVQVGFQRRFDDGYRAAQAEVASGAVGTVLVVRAATHDPAPPPQAFMAGSGGIFRDLNIHDFDAIRFVTGRAIVEVYAAGAVRETPWFAELDDVDAAVAVLRLDDGALGVLTGSRREPHGYDVRLEVLGTRDSVAVAPAETRHPSFVERFGAAYRAELAAFVDAVRAGGPSPCTIADARAALAVAIAAERSRREGVPVAVDDAAGAESAH